MLQAEYPLQNYITSAPYSLRPVLHEFADTSRLDQLISICNEPLIYNFLFREKLSNKPYTRQDAEKFFQWSAKGWKEQQYFVYLIESEQGEIAAAIDLKSADKALVEIGYWSSSKHRGVMTNALSAIIKAARAAGYKNFYAIVRKDNASSQKVLMNNQFMIDAEWQGDKARYRFIRSEC